MSSLEWSLKSEAPPPQLAQQPKLVCMCSSNNNKQHVSVPNLRINNFCQWCMFLSHQMFQEIDVSKKERGINNDKANRACNQCNKTMTYKAGMQCTMIGGVMAKYFFLTHFFIWGYTSEYFWLNATIPIENGLV